MISFFTTSVELGLLYSLIVFGVHFSFRILRFPDLTADGSFVVGAAITGVAIRAGISGVFALFLGTMCGFITGLLTAFFHIRFGIEKILAGILTLYMLYTVNLHIMNGPNVSLINQTNIIGWFTVGTNHIVTMLFLCAITLCVKVFIDWFLATEFGLFVRGSGINEETIQTFGFNAERAKWIGLGISNGLIGLGGGLFAQYQGFADVNMGIGTIIVGLAGLMIGETILRPKTIPQETFAIILGSLLYQLVINSALYIGFAGNDLKLITAIIVALCLIVGQRVKKAYGKSIFTF